MAEEKVSILYQLKDLASKGIQKIQGGLADLGVAANKSSKEAEQLQKNWEGMGRVGQTLAVGAGVVAAGLGAVGWAALKAAGDFEQNKIAFETMLGSAEAAKVLLGQLKDLAVKTPFEYKDLVEYSKRLLAMGISASSVTEDMKMLGDISAGVGQDKLPQLVLAFGQVNAAGRLTGMELRQFTEAGVPLLDALATRFGKTTTEILTMVSKGQIGFSAVQEALKGMTGEGGKFFNLMEKQSGTLTGEISNLSDSVGFLARDFGESLLPIIKPVIDGFRGLVDWLGQLSPETKKYIAIAGGVVFVLSSLAAAFGTILAAIPFVVAGATTLGITFAGLASATGIGALVVAVGYLATVIVKNWNVVLDYTDKLQIGLLNGFKAIMVGIDALIDKYNAIAKKVPGIPVLDLGLDAQIQRMDTLIKRIEDAGAKRSAASIKTVKEDKKPVSFSAQSSAQKPEILDGKTDKGADKQLEQIMAKYDAAIAHIKETRDATKSDELAALTESARGYQLNTEDKAKLELKFSEIKGEIRKEELEAIKEHSKELLTDHEERVTAMMDENTYSYDAEIAMLENLKNTHQLTNEDMLKVSKKINDLTKKSSEEAGKAIIAQTEADVARKKALGELSLQDEIKINENLLNSDKITKQQKTDLALKLRDLETQLLVQKKQQQEFLFSEEQKQLLEIQRLKQQGFTAEMQLQKVILDSARTAGNQKLSIERQIANGILDVYKRQIIAEVDAMAARWAIEATGRIAGSWGFDIGAWGLLAAAAGASAGIRSALGGIQLAHGGIVQARPGGVQATIGEGGSDEAVIPLDSKRGKQALGGMNWQEMQVLILSDDGSQLAKALWRKQKELLRTGQIT